MIRSSLFEATHSTSSYEITPVEKRRTTIFLTKFEVTRIVAERAKQIVNGSATSPFTAHSVTMSARDAMETAERCADGFSLAVDPVMMAKYDLVQGRIPMIVQRMWPNGEVENIPVTELQVDPLLLDLNYWSDRERLRLEDIPILFFKK